MKHIKSEKVFKFVKGLTSSLSFAAILLSMSGCGGTPEYYVDESTGMHSQVSEAGNRQHTYATNNRSVQPSHSAAKERRIASSFTMRPTENFRGFNPEIWNKQQAWTECNCGDNQPLPPQIMNWNPAG